MSSNIRTNTISAILFIFFCLISAIGLISSDAGAAFTRTQVGGLTEGLLVEAHLTQGVSVVAGRVLIEAGRAEWTTIASTSPAKKGRTPQSKSQLKLEVRATLLDSDVVEVETRVTGVQEQTGKLIVRLGESAVMTSSQMESVEPAPGIPVNAAPVETSIGVKILRVRYSL